MIVCNCNGISETAIKAAAAEGKTAKQLFAQHGDGKPRPNCRRCIKEIAAALKPTKGLNSGFS